MMTDDNTDYGAREAKALEDSRTKLHKAAKDFTLSIARAEQGDELATARIGACMVQLEEAAVNFAVMRIRIGK